MNFLKLLPEKKSIDQHFLEFGKFFVGNFKEEKEKSFNEIILNNVDLYFFFG